MSRDTLERGIMEAKDKIAFIICVNDEQSYEECLYYLDKLSVPQDMSVEVLAIRDADSIYKAYNYAMQQSDAKYKIYMHQDVFLVHTNILIDIIELFRSNDRIGMIGLLGGTQIPQNKRFYRSWDVGNVLGCNDKKAFWNELSQEQRCVWAIDGMFMATQYDVLWREELEGWDFYDISQSIEFAKAGYEVWVPNQKEPWSVHDCGYLNLTAYDKRLERFLELYGDELPSYDANEEVYPEKYQAKLELMMQVKEEMKALFMYGQEQSIKEALDKVWDERFVDTEFVVLKNMIDIVLEEKQNKEQYFFLADVNSFEEASEKYRRVKYDLWRNLFLEDVSKPDVFTRTSNAAIEHIKERSIWKDFSRI